MAYIEGVVPYEDFRHKDKVVDQLRREFNRKVTIRVDSIARLVFYEHRTKSSVLKGM